MSLSVQHKLTEAWICSEFFAEINGCEVREGDILDYEQVYGGCSIKGKLMFADTQGFMSGEVEGSSSLAIGGHFRIGWIAAGSEKCGGKCKEDFIIEKVRSGTENNKRVVILDLIDTDTKNLKGTHVTKGYKDKEYSKGMEEHMKNVTSMKNLTVIPPEKEAKRDFAVPSNVNFFDFLQQTGKENGMKLVRDKHDSYFVSKDWTEFNKLKDSDESFEVDTDNEYSFWKILQYNIDGFNMGALMDSIPTSLSVNPRAIHGKDEEKMESSLSVDSKKSTLEGGVKGHKQSDNIHTRGQKTGIKNNEMLHQYYTTLSNAQKCSIWVPGLNWNRVAKRVRVDFPRPQYLKQDQYDQVFSGYWEIYAVRDKIISQYFVQELFLRRTGGK